VDLRITGSAFAVEQLPHPQVLVAAAAAVVVAGCITQALR